MIEMIVCFVRWALGYSNSKPDADYAEYIRLAGLLAKARREYNRRHDDLRFALDEWAKQPTSANEQWTQHCHEMVNDAARGVEAVEFMVQNQRRRVWRKPIRQPA